MVWPYLNSNILHERYKIIKKLINTENIIDLGNSNAVPYENNIEIYRNKKIITVDIQDSKYKIKKKINIQHFKYSTSDFVKSNFFNNYKKKNYNLILFGLNAVNIERNYTNAKKEIASLYELSVNAKRIFIEYPVNFWASKTEAELLISFLAKKILFFKTKEYRTFPTYTQIRNLVVFDNNKNKKNLNAFISNFLKIRFNNFICTNLKKIEFKKFEINFNNIKISSSLKYAFKIILASKIFVFGMGKPWSYVLTLNNISGIEKQYKLSFCGLFQNLLIGLSMDNKNIVHEISLRDLEDKIIRIRILPKQTAIIRLGASSLFLFLFLSLRKK
jgi:hypothetical protein